MDRIFTSSDYVHLLWLAAWLSLTPFHIKLASDQISLASRRKQLGTNSKVAESSTLDPLVCLGLPTQRHLLFQTVALLVVGGLVGTERKAAELSQVAAELVWLSLASEHHLMQRVHLIRRVRLAREGDTVI